MRLSILCLLLGCIGVMPEQGFAQRSLARIPTPADTLPAVIYNKEQLLARLPQLTAAQADSLVPPGFFDWYTLAGRWDCYYCSRCPDRQPCHRNACGYGYNWYMEKNDRPYQWLQARWCMDSTQVPDSLVFHARLFDIPYGDDATNTLIWDAQAREVVWIIHWIRSRRAVPRTPTIPFKLAPQVKRQRFPFTFPRPPAGYTLRYVTLEWWE